MTEHDQDALDEKQKRLDRLRGSGVGTEDPNIVGDVGPTDVAPGSDPQDPHALPRDELEGDPTEPDTPDVDSFEPTGD